MKHPRFLLPLSFLVLATLACSVLSGASVSGTTGGGQDQEVNVASSSSNILFQDDFSDPGSGWDSIRDGDGVTDYENGGYRFLINLPNWWFWTTPSLHFTDVRLEVETTKLSGPDVNEFGLICRYQDPDNFYFLTISSDGFYGVSKFVDGEETLIGMESLQSNPAILQGEASNRLRADCVGSRLTLFVNDQVLAEVEDGDFSSGDVGMIAGTFDEPGTDVLFDNFVVMRP